MTEDIPQLSPQARTLLERERPIPALSPMVRARAMAAARTALAAGPLPAPPPRAPAAWTRWAAAAALTCAASAAVAAIAYRRHDSDPALGLAAPAGAALPSQALIEQADPQLGAGPFDTDFDDSGARHARTPVPREELRLLRQARDAVARDDFAAALSPIAQHAREFPTGRLAEEREALRVKALVGLGRFSEARRAADGFEARFPRSVLLPAIQRMAAPGGPGDHHR